MDREQELQRRIAELEGRLSLALKRIEQLEKELEQYRKHPKDSGNSSIPPSQDPCRKPREQKPSGRKPGGQPGHQGHFHAFSDTPDRIEPLHPEICSACGSPDLLKLEAYTQARQVVNLPEMKPVVTEYRTHKSQCRRCGQLSVGCFPQQVHASVQIDQSATGLIGYLKAVHHLSHQRIVRMLADCFGVSVSEGFVEHRPVKPADTLEPAYRAIGEALKAQSVLGSDETRNRVNGSNGQVWVFQNETLCYFHSSPSRGFSVVKDVIGESFPGVWVSDRYGAQLKIESRHQLCLSHLLRDLNYAVEAGNSAWAKGLKRLLQNAMRLRRQEGFTPANTRFFRSIRYFEKKLARFFDKPPPEPQAHKLYKSLLGRQDQMLTFLRYPDVPYDNNGSERALRNRVVHRKVTGGFRTPEGSRRHDILGSILETAKRQGLNLLNALSGKCQPLLTT